MTENEKKHKKREGLRQARLRRGLSFDELAGLMGLNEDRTPRRWESGETTPHPGQRPLLAEHLGITLDELALLLEENAHKEQIWMIPFKRNPYFTGREDLLARLHTILQIKNSVLLTHAVTGLGGIGKTLLAVEYAYRYYKDDLTGHAVLWAQADSQEALFFAFQMIAQALNLPEKEQQNQHVIVAAVKHWLVTHTDWLLIFDNVEDMQTIQDFLPDSGSKITGHILLTTRLQASGTIVAVTLDIESMTLQEGETFLLRRTKKLALQQSLDHEESDDRKIAQMLCQEMGGLPLALDQAGAYIEETGCSLARYLERYQTQRGLLLARRGDLAQKEDVHPQPVTVTFLLSLEKIAEKNPAAADLLRFCAFLAPDDIPEDLFLRCSTALPSTLQVLVADPEHFEEAIALIRRYSLVQRLATNQSLSIHRVVQAVIQNHLEEQKQRKNWETMTVTAIAEAFADADQYNIIEEYKPYIPHALTAVDLIHQRKLNNHVAGHLLYFMGLYQMLYAQYSQAEIFSQEALELYRQILEPDHPEIASNLTNLALVYEEKRMHVKSQALLEQALTILEKSPLSRSITQARALLNLAKCYWSQGKFFEAEQRAQQALLLFGQFAEPISMDTAAGLRQLATIYRDQGKRQKAASLYQQALDIYKKITPLPRSSIAFCLEESATNRFLRSEFTEAVSQYKEALHIFEAVWGKDHPNVAGCLCRLADACMVLRNFPDVEKYNKRALAIYEQVGGPDYPEINQPLQGLAILYHFTGKDMEQAELWYKRAICLIENSQGPEHPDLVAALQSYAGLLWIKKDRDTARKLIQRSKAIEQKILGH